MCSEIMGVEQTKHFGFWRLVCYTELTSLKLPAGLMKWIEADSYYLVCEEEMSIPR